MKYNEARKSFKYALENQSTIRVSKLTHLMQSMNMSLEPSESKEVIFLKRKVSKLVKENKKLRRKIK